MEYQHTLDEIVYGEGVYTFSYKVKGYLSEDMIYIHVQRKWYFDPEQTGSNPVKPGWIVEMRHSSGNRNTDEVKDDIDASSNFVAVMLEAIDFAMLLKGQVDVFEAAYMLRVQDEKRKRDDEMKRRKSVPTIGEKIAKVMILHMEHEIKDEGKDEATLWEFDPIKDHGFTISAFKTEWSDRIRFTYSDSGNRRGRVISKAKAIQAVATAQFIE